MLKLFNSAALALLLAGLSAHAETGATMTLFDFDSADTGAWTVVNDGVMGGLSTSSMRRTEQGTGLFAGTVSLENNGGFASVRYALAPHDYSEYGSLELRVRGDGRSYQLRLRTNRGFDGVAYRAVFTPAAGVWTTLELPFAAFEPVYRGRIVAGAPPLDRSSLQQVGFLIADKVSGPFTLEIDAVRAVPSAKDTP